MPITTSIHLRSRRIALAAWFGMTAFVAMGAAMSRVRAHQPNMTPTPAKLSVLRASAAALPTRSLFRYQRDDRSPGLVTRVHIDAAVKAAQSIHPHLFGNFIEHLGGVIYEGLWAQILLNPNLERTEAKETAPPYWELRGAARWAEGGYLSPRSVRLSPGKTDAPGEMAQMIHLPAHRTRAYTLTLHLRASEGQSKIGIAITSEDKAERTLASASRLATSVEWQKVTVPLKLSAGVLAKGAPARFRLRLLDGKPVVIDQVELFPNDAIDGMDPDVIARARAWHIPIVRYPGGNFVSGYRWQDGIGPRDQRPTRRNPAWGGVEPNHFGTDEFMKFCRLIGAEPQITVNAGDGTPEDAAAWVRYCNARPETDAWARRRAANASIAPYHVRIWEIGNELYGDWQIGHTDPAGNAARFARFREAMHKADPTIALIATGRGEEFTPEGWKQCEAWNEKLLRAALADGGRAPDYLSIHPLVPLPYLTGPISYAEQYESAMAHPTYLSDTLFPALARLISDIEGPNAKTRIAPTEWGIIVGGDRWWEGPNHDVQAGAVYNALALNAMIRNSDWVTLANMTAFMHGGGIKKPNGVVIVDPQYWTQELYATARPQTSVETITTGPGRDVPARGLLPAVPNVPDVDVVAALTKGGQALVVFAVNRHRTEARPLRLDVQNYAAATLSATLLSAPDPQARNTIENPNAVAPRPFPVPAGLPTTGKAWQVTLPPHSLTVFTLRR